MKRKDFLDGMAVNDGALLYQPTTGDWDYVAIEDNEGDYYLCDNCQKEEIRYEHHIQLKAQPEIRMVVGCICVQHLIKFDQTDVDPQKLVAKMQNAAAARARRLARIEKLEMEWWQKANGNFTGVTSDCKKAARVRYTVFPSGKGYKWVRNGQNTFSQRVFPTVIDAESDALSFEKITRRFATL